jgi:tellurite resistance protein
VPGTGLYNRQYLKSGRSQQVGSGQQSPGLGCGGCLVTFVLVIVAVVILARISERGNAAVVGLILLAVVLLGFFAFRQIRGGPIISPAAAAPQNSEWLGHEMKAMLLDLTIPVKNELRKSRVASGYEDIFTNCFFTLVCRFAALDGLIDAKEGKVFLEIFNVLHPKSYGGLLPEDGAALLEGHRQRHPETLLEPTEESMLFRFTKQAGHQFADRLKELMYKVALNVALADGPLSPIEQSELEALRRVPTQDALAERTDASPVEIVTPKQQSTNGQIQPVAQELKEPHIQSEASQEEMQVRPSTKSNEITLSSLKDISKDFVDAIIELLKTEMRESRQSTMARDFFEQDLRAVIIHFGCTDGKISRDAAHLYLELFRQMHPMTYSGWSVDNSINTLEQIVQKNPDSYIGGPVKPYTLAFIESFDASHGTNFKKSTCDFLMAVAVFAAAVDGTISDDRTAAIRQLKAMLESHG